MKARSKRSSPPAATRRRQSVRRPFLLMNMSMTADGKIASTNRAVSSFSSARDQHQLHALRATADAVMCGARTVDLNRVTLGPGGAKYRQQRQRRGLAEYNLRIVVTGSGTLDPRAHLFRHRFSPIIILTTGRATAAQLERLRAVATEVKVFGERELDWQAALRWLAKNWRVKRLLCEGGGELNDALFRAGLVDELHLTVCPRIIGGRAAPTIVDGAGFDQLDQATKLRLVRAQQHHDELFLRFQVVR